MKPKASGEIPLDIEVEFEYNGKKYIKSFFFEVLVDERLSLNKEIKQPSDFTPKPLSTSLPPELAINYKNVELIGQGANTTKGNKPRNRRYSKLK